MVKKIRGRKVKVTDSPDNRIKLIIIKLSIFYIAIITISIISVMFTTLRRSSDSMTNKVGKLLSSVDSQMKLNIDTYFKQIENLSTLIFTNEEFYEYKPSSDNSDNSDEYSRVELGDKLQDRLIEISVMQNFSDFGIVYSNGETIGRISNGTSELYGKDLYKEFALTVNESNKEDGWSTGYLYNYDRIYYAKRLNSDAILIEAIYSSEMAQTLSVDESINNVYVRLSDDKGRIIYSSKEEEFGKTLDFDIRETISNNQPSTVMTSEDLISFNECTTGWNIVCSIKLDTVLQDNMDVARIVIIITAFIALISSVVCYLILTKITSPISVLMDGLNVKASFDQLTGVMNKKAFESSVDTAVSVSVKSHRTIGFLLLDVDNFKGINDNYGHAYGDSVLSQIGVFMRSMFSGTTLLGRLGGDEFAVMIATPDNYKGDPKEYIINNVQNFYDKTYDGFNRLKSQAIVTLSGGLAICPDDGTSFEELYKNADKALYVIKKNGKGTFNVFDGGGKNET